uniref:Uncharacterized protein n=1 Tax=viral metagenome TaxID=1070528 RepID=A0A6M3LQL6_9ZZZZ
MRKFDVYLAGGEYATTSFCDEHCDDCKWRYLCYTTKDCNLAVTMDGQDLMRHFVVRELENRDGTRLMRCPHCNAIFTVKAEQLSWNEKFKCKACHRFNYGSHEADDYGVLIGCPFDNTLWK